MTLTADKRRLRLAAALLVAFSCAGCGNEASTTPPQPGNSGQTTTEVVETCEEFTVTATQGPVPSASSPEAVPGTDCTTPTPGP